MPVQSRRDGDVLLVDNVDLKRTSRNLLNKVRTPGWTPPKDLNQAMELVAACLGYGNLLAANTAALSKAAEGVPLPLAGSSHDPGGHLKILMAADEDRSPFVRLPPLGPDGRAMAYVTADIPLGQAFSVHPAPNTFPDGLGPRFDQRWKNLVSLGLISALTNTAAAGSDLVAVIGRPGAGKSLLVNAMSQALDGAVVDFRLASWRDDFDRIRRAPPSVVFIEEMYHQSEATKMEVAAFALSSHPCKVVYVFQDHATLTTEVLSRQDPSGEPLFKLARVVNLDRLTEYTAYCGRPIDDLTGLASRARMLVLDSGFRTQEQHEAANAEEPARSPHLQPKVTFTSLSVERLESALKPYEDVDAEKLLGEHSVKVFHPKG